ncbi:MAG TPA: hypothetical protein DIT04_12435 [Dysgonomonas sp.]|nr:hypothetical protein [Dysgonomonas sp.]
MHITAILCLLIVYASAQAWVIQRSSGLSEFLPQPEIQQNVRPDSQPTRIIQLIRAKLLDHRLGADIDIFIDSVVLYHEGAYMYCDSAYVNRLTNTFEAFGTVQVEQGDTLFLYGKYLEYDGNTQLLRVRREVRLENTNDNVTLFTDSLDYDRTRDIGYYFDGGMLVDTLNEMTSYYGQYEPSKHLALFQDSVILVNPNFTLYTDTLLYNTTTKVADITGFSTIVSDSATIYTTRGWYNTETEESLLLDQSRIVNIEGYRSLVGDSILYNKRQGIGEVFGNMYLEDTIQKIILTGDYGFYNELTNYAMTTKRARAIEFSQGDSLFIHGDTLKLITHQLSPDTVYREIKAYYGVRFFRIDLQGVCDSLQFNTQDSILHMYRDPVLWNENNQILGDTITVFFNDSTIDWSHVRPNAFAIQNLDSLHFNQVKGRDMKAYFENKDIKHVLVEGNAESIFYPEERDKTMIGMNHTESNYLSMDFLQRKIQRIKIWPKPVGKMTPIPDILPGTDKLGGFVWLDYIRPLDKDDIFREVERKGSDSQQGRRGRRSTSPPPSSTPSQALPADSVSIQNGEVIIGTDTINNPEMIITEIQHQTNESGESQSESENSETQPAILTREKENETEIIEE